MKKNKNIKRWMQGIGLVYVLLLTGIFFPLKNNLFFFTEEIETYSQNRDAGGKSGEENQETGNAKKQDSNVQNGETETDITEREKPKIALTFDDGPIARYTPILLDGLKKRGVHATFFLIGKNIESGENSEIVRREYEEGHLIGNHTYNHVEITQVSNDTACMEIQKTNEIISSITGEEVAFMRPPFGLWQKELEQKVCMIPVMWTIDPLDWSTENEDEIVNKVVSEAEENDIILLHDCYQSSVNAALRIVDLLQAEGFEFVTVDELLVE